MNDRQHGRTTDKKGGGRERFFVNVSAVRREESVVALNVRKWVSSTLSSRRRGHGECFRSVFVSASAWTEKKSNE